MKDTHPMFDEPRKWQPHESAQDPDGQGKGGIIHKEKGNGNGIHQDGLSRSKEEKGVEFIFRSASVHEIFTGEPREEESQIDNAAATDEQGPDGYEIGEENAYGPADGPNNQPGQGGGQEFSVCKFGPLLLQSSRGVFHFCIFKVTWVKLVEFTLLEWFLRYPMAFT